jgi:hypothetical protein
VHRDMRNIYKILFESLRGRDHLRNLCIGGIIILKYIVGNRFEGCGLGSSLSVWGPVVGCCEHRNEP